MRLKTPSFILPAFLLICYLVIANLAAYQMSLTSDEAVHLASGYRYLKHSDFRWNREHPPLIKEIAALPMLLMDIQEMPTLATYEDGEEFGKGERFLYKYNREKFPENFKYSRFMMSLLGCLLALFIYLWGIKLYGKYLALLPLAIFALDPNFLGHGPLIATDVGSLAFLVGAFYFCWLALERQRLLYFLYSGVFFGLAQSSKHSALLAFPILGLLLTLAIALNKDLISAVAAFSKKHFRKLLLFYLLLIVAFLSVKIVYSLGIAISAGLLVLLLLHILLAKAENLIVIKQKIINLSLRYGLTILFSGLLIAITMLLVTPIFFFDYSWSILVGDVFRSFNNIQSVISHAQGGHGVIFLNGEYSREGFPLYYLYAFFIKTPIPTLILIGLGIIFTIFSSAKTHTKLFLLLPPLLFLALITYVNKAQIGLRHAYFIYPFLYLMVPYFFIGLGKRLNTAKLITLSLLFISALIFNLYAAFPHLISYTNGALFPQKDAYKYISNSNLDWGQGNKELIKFLENVGSPQVYTYMWYKNIFANYGYKNFKNISNDNMIDETFSGLLIVDVQMYNRNGHVLSWLKANKQPDYIIDNSILLYLLGNSNAGL
ncbi:MAG: glycosyltransferase family 39 protein [Deltaproteobacteria bacterium]|nr:glycosyltransferase family 39 protein [Deltaproteobacteria bacterium]